MKKTTQIIGTIGGLVIITQISLRTILHIGLPPILYTIGLIIMILFIILWAKEKQKKTDGDTN